MNSENQDKSYFKKKKVLWRFIITAGFVLVLVISALIFSLLAQKQKPDPTSENILRQAAASQLKDQTYIDKDPNELTVEDFAMITTFDFVEAKEAQSIIRFEPKISNEISDIKLLEKFTNLKALHFQYISYPKDKIPKWMKFLAQLGFYDLNERYTIDLSPIEKLTNLERLGVGGPMFKDIRPLSVLTNLKVLGLGNNYIRSLEPIKGLINLESLFFHGNQISDLEPISQLTNLRTLEFTQTRISDIEMLKGLINLENLRISDSPVSNLEPLKELINLKELWLINIPISDLKPLRSLKNLRNLTIFNCSNITDEQVYDLDKTLIHLRIQYE